MILFVGLLIYEGFVCYFLLVTRFWWICFWVFVALMNLWVFSLLFSVDAKYLMIMFVGLLIYEGFAVIFCWWQDFDDFVSGFLWAYSFTRIFACYFLLVINILMNLFPGCCGIVNLLGLCLLYSVGDKLLMNLLQQCYFFPLFCSSNSNLMHIYWFFSLFLCLIGLNRQFKS